MKALRPLLLLGALLAPAVASAGNVACGAPEEMLETSAALPATARAVASGSLRVVVAGSASVLGPGTSGPGAPWPARLKAMLEARHPGLQVEMVVRGGRGFTTADTAALVAGETAQAPTQLVLWQAGTVEAVRGLDVDDMVDALNAGLDRLRGAGTDAALIDLQFSRFLRANANVEPYREALRLVAAAHDVPLIRRYELMQFWAETERVDLERAPRNAKVATADRLNDCLAQAILVVLEEGIAQARPQPAGKP
jgi:hypothetical protein